MAIAKVHVFEKLHRYLVRPASVAVRAGDLIHFVNHTRGGIEAVWPRVTPFRNVASSDERLREVRFRDTDVAVEVARAERGAYPYAVFCAAGNGFGEGESSPMVIVED